MAYASNKRIYLDYAAATPISPLVREAMERAYAVLGNPSSIHEEGRQTHALLTEARAAIAHVLGVSPEELIFTGSGSEADAMALWGVARAYKHLGRHIVVSAIEHKAILKTAALLEEEGFEVTYVPSDTDGIISPDALKQALRPDTILVSVMYANNEIGTIEPITELSNVIQQVRGQAPVPLFHTDAAQAPGHLPIRAHDLGVDLMSLNAAKAYGPKGVGVLYVRRGVSMKPMVGGEQEKGLRGGTENVALIAGCAAALREAESMREEETKRLKALQEYCFDEILDRIPDAIVNGSRTNRLSNNVHVSFPYVEGESILLLLDAAGIACATGSACNSFDLAPSHVLLAIGTEAGLSHGSVRFSFGRDTTQADITYAVHVLAQTVAVLRSVSALTVPTNASV